MSDTLIAFVKVPRPGQVKTRLAARLGSELAADFYRWLAERELESTRPLAQEYQRVVFYAPAGEAAGVAAWLPGEALQPQGDGDLGARMHAAFEQSFAGGARHVALIGSDVPWVSRRHVTAALQALAGQDLVLGPTGDGGYYLIALRAPQPALFDAMPWSTPQVLPQTLDRAAALGLSARLLEPLDDIDTFEDLQAVWARLRPLLERDSALLARLEQARGY